MATPAPGAVGFQRTTVDVGRDEWASFLGLLITGGQVSYFKLGEGGWNESEEVTATFGQGVGVASTDGIIPGPPLIPGSITIDAGGTRQVTDTPNSPWDGTGVFSGNGNGTVNYKTNEFSVTFLSIIPGSQDIDITRKHRGEFSGIHTEDIAEGDGTTGPYAGTLGVYPVYPGSVRVFGTDEVESFADDGVGVLTGDQGGSGTINYTTGAISVTFNSSLSASDYARAEYRAEGVPRAPEAGVSALVAESDSELTTFQKTLTPGVDMVFQGVGTAQVLATIVLTTAEGNDDGTSNPPFWTEGALYSDNDVMLVYFTFPGIRKTSSDTFQRQLELTGRV